MAGTTASVRDPWEQQQSENADQKNGYELYVCMYIQDIICIYTYIENKRYMYRMKQIPWTILFYECNCTYICSTLCSL